MRFLTKKPKVEPLAGWHLHFAWFPVKFEYGTWPDNAWMEVVLRRRHPSQFWFENYIYEYAPRESAIKYPHQYGIGVTR